METGRPDRWDGSDREWYVFGEALTRTGIHEGSEELLLPWVERDVLEEVPLGNEEPSKWKNAEQSCCKEGGLECTETQPTFAV